MGWYSRMGQKVKKGIGLGVKLGVGIGGLYLGYKGLQGDTKPNHNDIATNLMRQAEQDLRKKEIDDLMADYNKNYRKTKSD